MFLKLRAPLLVFRLTESCRPRFYLFNRFLFNKKIKTLFLFIYLFLYNFLRPLVAGASSSCPFIVHAHLE